MDQQRVKDVLFDVLEHIPEDRERVLDELCAGDHDLAARVRELLDSHDDAGEFMADPSLAPTAIFGGSPAADHETNAPIDPIPNEVAGRHVIRKLGEGGYGVVYLAEEREPVERLVAIKVIKPGMGSQEVLARFEAERRTLALMSHPGIAHVFEAGTTDDGRPYVVMERIEGEPITEYCRTCDLPLDDRLELIAQVCLAVQHAHQKGVIHRDIKPSNVLVSRVDGQPVPKVIDFGIAKAVQGPLADGGGLTQTMQIIGTPQYMSPEQASFNSTEVDTRSDVYSIGALMYECVTGAPPFEVGRFSNAGAAEFERIIKDEDPIPPSTRASQLVDTPTRGESGSHTQRLAKQLRGEVDWIIQRAMAKEPERRYQTANALAMDIRRFLEGDAVEAGPPSGLYRMRKLVRRYRVEVGAALLILLALFVATGISIVYATRANRARVESERELAKYEAIADFTQEMLSGVDPSVARGADTELFEHILASAAGQIQELPPDEPEVEVTLRTMIALAYRSIGEYDEATDVVRPASVIANTNLGATYPLTMETDSVHGVILAENGRLHDALGILESIYERRLEQFGQEDERTLEAHSNVAHIHQALGAWTTALEWNKRGYEMRREHLGPEHPDTMASLNAYAVSLGNVGRDEESAALLEQVVAFQTNDASLGPDHPHTLMTKNNLAGVYLEVGQRDRANEILSEVLESKRRVLPPNHPSILVTLNTIASAQIASGDRSRALELQNEAMQIADVSLPPTHVRTLILLFNRGKNLLELERLDEARADLERASVGLAEHAGPTDVRTLLASAYLQRTRSASGERDDVLSNLEVIVADVRTHVPAAAFSHLVTALECEAAALSDHDRHQDAAARLREAYQLVVDNESTDHRRATSLASKLAEIHASLGDEDTAAVWTSRAEHDDN